MGLFDTTSGHCCGNTGNRGMYVCTMDGSLQMPKDLEVLTHR